MALHASLFPGREHMRTCASSTLIREPLSLLGLLMVLLLPVQSCDPKHRGGQTPVPQAAGGDSVFCCFGGPLGDDFGADSVQWGEIRLRQLAWMIWRYDRAIGSPPTHLWQVINGAYVADSVPPILDLWGSSVSYAHWPDSASIGSAGPDRMAGTADDIVVTVLFGQELTMHSNRSRRPTQAPQVRQDP